MEILKIWNARVMVAVGARLNAEEVSRIEDVPAYHPSFNIYVKTEDGKEKLFRTIYASDMEVDYK